MMRKKKIRSPRIDTLIGNKTAVEGDISFDGALHVDGKLKGNVLGSSESNTTVTVSDKGVIEGDIRVPNVVLNGKVVGNVYASERIELASEARVTGNVYYNVIEMAPGAEVNGSLVHEVGKPAKPAPVSVVKTEVDEASAKDDKSATAKT